MDSLGCTELEWLSATDAVWLVNHLRIAASDRKLRLLGCAFCRDVWARLPELGRRAVEIAEQFADGSVNKRTRIRYEQRIAAARELEDTLPLFMAQAAISETGWYSAELTVGCGANAEREVDLVRDIFGNRSAL